MIEGNLEKKNIFYLLIKFWKFLNKKRQDHLKVLFLTMLFSTLAEMVNLALIVPFLGILSNPESTMELSFFKDFVNLFGIYNLNQFRIFITVLFLIASIFSGLVRILNTWLTLNICSLIAADISKDAYKKSIYQNYDVHINRNSSNLIAAMVKDVDRILTYILNPILYALSSIFIAFGILITLFLINWFIAFVTFFSISLVYLIINFFNRRPLLEMGIKQVQLQGRFVQNVQEGIGSIKDILLSSSQPLYVNIFSKAVYPLRRIEAHSTFLGYYPKLMIEPIGLSVIAILGFFVSRNDEINNVIPVLGALALGSMRLLPLAQRIYEGVAFPQNGKGSLISILNLLQQSYKEPKYIKNKKLFLFDKNIVFKNVRFTYPGDEKEIIKNLNLEIKKGDKIGIIGSTGSGKSTTIDLIMGLIKPDSGSILIDGKHLHSEKNNDLLHSWQSNIVHVPQSIYLIDNSIAQNIAFGTHESKFNYEKIIKAAKAAQIDSFINTLPNGYQTFIGENGILLSGGQRQRIGIARALYRDIRILILDEATSALDFKTESKIIKSIEKVGKEITVIMISHSKNSLVSCDRILEIKDKVCIEISPEEYFINN